MTNIYRSKEAQVINVYLTNSTVDTLSRSELLNWVNKILSANFLSIEEMCTGAAYCQLLDLLFPGSIQLSRVRFTTNLEHECIENYKLVQSIFDDLNVQKFIPIDKLTRGKFHDNFEFLQWFKRFYDANVTNLDYDALESRNGAPMAYGTSIGTNFGLSMRYRQRDPQPQRQRYTRSVSRNYRNSCETNSTGIGAGARRPASMTRSIRSTGPLRRSSSCSLQPQWQTAPVYARTTSGTVAADIENSNRRYDIMNAASPAYEDVPNVMIHMQQHIEEEKSNIDGLESRKNSDESKNARTTDGYGMQKLKRPNRKIPVRQRTNN